VVDYKELLGAAPEPSEPPIGPGPEDPAYILFTSGSTGTPKGVVIPHSAIVNMLSWVLRTFSRQELDRVLVGTSLTFDFSVLQIFAPLAVGGCAVLPDNVLALRDLNTSITLLGTSPSVLGALLDERAIPRHVGTIMSGGEALSKEMATRLLALEQRPRLVNIYGPTETTVLCSASEVSNVETIPPIGKPIDGALTLVMDRLGQPLPAGTSGELWVGGRGVSRGYLNDAALTAERFVEAEIPSLGLQRMYRTGDRVWADEQGSLHFVRRLDNQLKLRGIRVEPGDVEAALLAHPDVTAAAVYVVGDEAARELHAAVVSRNGPVDAEELQSFAKRRLPRHMVPKRIHHLERLPVNQNGKVDRSALSATSAEIQRCRPPDSLESFQNLESLESLLLSTWERLLKTRGLEPESDFFDSGGDSLLVLAMLTEVERVVGCRLPLDWCFSGPITVHRLAMKVQEVLDAGSVGAHDEARSAHVIPLRVTGGKPPLFVIFADAAMALSARALAEALHPDRPVYALAPIWTNVASRSELARRIASVITELSPWMAHLAGHSVGGLLAYETAGLLDDSGHTVGTTILVDTVTPGAARLSYRRQPLRRRVRVALRLPAFWRAAFWRAAAPAIGDYRFPFDRTPELFWKDDPAPIRRHVDLLITPTSAERYGALLGWADVHKGELTPRTVPGDHIGVLRSPNVEQLARTLDLCLDAVDSAPLNAER
jgi:amino acid adenylation domain-containing protein